MSTTETVRRILSTAIVALVFVLLPAQAQQQRVVYNVGEAVEIDPALSGQWSKATVLEVKSLSGKAYGYVVRVDEGPAGPGQILRLPVSRFRPSATGQNRPSAGPFRVGDTVEVDQFNKGQWKRATIVEVHANGAGYLIAQYSGPGVSGAMAQLPANQVRPWNGNSASGTVPSTTDAASQGLTTGQNPGQFKVVDRVMASSISAMEAPYRPCTVTAPPLHGTYGLRCDPWQGRAYDDTAQFPEYVRAWPNATPAPNVGTCTFDVPQGTVSRSATASPQLFQHVIYEKQPSQGQRSG